MEKELIINLGLNKRPAEQAEGEYVQGSRQRLQKLLTDVEVMEAAKTVAVQRENQRRIAAEVSWLEAAKGAGTKRLTDVEAKEAAHSRLVERENAKRIQSFMDAFSREEKEAARALTDVEVAEQAKTRFVERGNQQRVQAAVQAMLTEEERIGRLLTETEVAEKAKAAVVERTNRQRVDAAVRAEMKEEEQLAKVLTKEQVVFRARDALIQRHNQQRIDGEVKSMEASQKGWEATSDAIGVASRALGSYAMQMVGLDSVRSVLGAIAERFQEAKRQAMEAVKFTQGYREALLELAALKGDLGDSTKTLREDLAFRAKTLQSADASREFQKAALGAGQAAIGVNISSDEFKNLTELGGMFQSFENGSAATHGRLVGMIPTLMGGKDLTAEQAFAKEQQLFRIFQPGGADFTPLTNQFLQQAPLVTSGIFRDPAQMAALLSAFSTTNAEGAGTNVQQFTRATVGGLGRMKGANVEGLVEKQGEYLKGLGATNQMDPIAIGKLISADFARQEQHSAQQGQTFNALDYLKTHGFANQEDMMSLLAFHGLMKSGQFAGTFEKLAGEVPTVQESLEPINLRRQVDPAFRARKEEIGAELTQVAVGQGQEETLKSVFRSAYNQLRANKEVTGEFEEIINRGMLSPSEFLFGDKAKVEMEAQHLLTREAERLGIDPRVEFLTNARTGQRTEQFMGRERLYGLAQEIQGRGGSLQPNFEGMAAAVDRQLQAAEKMERAAEMFLKANGPKNPPIAGRPRQVPTR